jgi:hemerythrin-like domain-containing protein
MVDTQCEQGAPDQVADVDAGVDACAARGLESSIVYDGAMLRDPNLIPLSRQHQHALALCVRLDRALEAGEIDTQAWQSEIQQQFESEIEVHFAAEEKELFPAAEKFPQLQHLVSELLVDHAELRNCFSRAASRSLDRQSLASFGEMLVQHIRKEERQLFEGMQRVMSSQEFATLGSALAEALKNAAQACAVPKEATRLKAQP